MYSEHCRASSDTALVTQWGEKSLSPASSGNFVVPYSVRAASEMNGLVAPDGERLDIMDGREQAGDGERWTERHRRMERPRD